MTDGGDNHNGASRRSTSATPMEPAFDSKPVIERLRRGGLDPQQAVDLLVLWMRKEHPQAQIRTDLAQFNETLAVVKAMIALPAGAEASGYGSALAADGDEMVERAETKAIGRALNALGYSIESFDGAAEPPRQRTQEPQRAATTQPAAPVAATPEPDEKTDEEPEPAPMRPRLATPSPVPPSPPEAASEEVEIDPADYSWTAFWRWARPRGFENRGAVEAFLGQTINNLTPGDVRRLIRERNDE
ncbi:MAG: hypothetical protein ACJ789_09175 [Thermomicrobiales bacterium]